MTYYQKERLIIDVVRYDYNFFNISNVSVFNTFMIKVDEISGSTMLKIYYGDDKEFTSYTEALLVMLIHAVVVVINLLILVWAMYHCFITKAIATNYKHVIICLICTLTFNVMFCAASAAIVTYNVTHIQDLSCAARNLVNVPLVGIARLFLYLYFIGRYAYTHASLSSHKLNCANINLRIFASFQAKREGDWSDQSCILQTQPMHVMHQQSRIHSATFEIL